jgi:hypothetical protein
MASKLQETIASLKPGDQFIVLTDEGRPARPRERLVTVWLNLDTQIITTDGTTVSPEFNSEIIPTGVHLDQFEPALAAKAAWMQIQSTMDVPRDLEQFESEPE